MYTLKSYTYWNTFNFTSIWGHLGTKRNVFIMPLKTPLDWSIYFFIRSYPFFPSNMQLYLLVMNRDEIYLIKNKKSILIWGENNMPRKYFWILTLCLSTWFQFPSILRTLWSRNLNLQGQILEFCMVPEHDGDLYLFKIT